MRKHFILFFFLLSPLFLVALFANKQGVIDVVPQQTYQCPPCGCAYENHIFNTPGKCPACGMTLVPATEGFQNKIDKTIAPLFYSSFLTKMYTKLLYPIFLAAIFFSLFHLIKAYLNQTFSFFLSLILLALSLFAFKSQLYGTCYQMSSNNHFLFTPISFILLLGPCLFFYLKKISPFPFEWETKYWWHFLPVLIFVGFYGFAFLLGQQNRNELLASPYEVSVSHLEQILTVSLGLIYLILSYQFIKSWKLTYPKTPLSLQLWLTRLLVGMGLLFSTWAILILTNFWLYGGGIATITYYPLWITLGLILLWLMVEINQNPKLILYGQYPLVSAILPTPNTALAKQKLFSMMKQEQLYLDKHLNLQALADKMDMNPRYLSSFLNQVVGKKFYEFINDYRIETAKKLLLAPENKQLTIEAIAQIAGFNSKSTFNTAFKKRVKMTPKQFIKKQKNK